MLLKLKLGKLMKNLNDIGILREKIWRDLNNPASARQKNLGLETESDHDQHWRSGFGFASELGIEISRRSTTADFLADFYQEYNIKKERSDFDDDLKALDFFYDDLETFMDNVLDEFEDFDNIERLEDLYEAWKAYLENDEAKEFLFSYGQKTDAYKDYNLHQLRVWTGRAISPYGWESIEGTEKVGFGLCDQVLYLVDQLIEVLYDELKGELKNPLTLEEFRAKYINEAAIKDLEGKPLSYWDTRK